MTQQTNPFAYITYTDLTGRTQRVPAANDTVLETMVTLLVNEGCAVAAVEIAE